MSYLLSDFPHFFARLQDFYELTLPLRTTIDLLCACGLLLAPIPNPQEGGGVVGLDGFPAPTALNTVNDYRSDIRRPLEGGGVHPPDSMAQGTLSSADSGTSGTGGRVGLSRSANPCRCPKGHPPAQGRNPLNDGAGSKGLIAAGPRGVSPKLRPYNVSCTVMRVDGAGWVAGTPPKM